MRNLSWIGNRNLLLTGAALASGALAYLLAQRYLHGQEAVVQQRLAGQYQTRTVLVAARNLPVGAELQGPALARRDVPERYLASDAVDADTVGGLLGRRLSRALGSGEAVTLSALESAGDAPLSSLVEPGLRAVTIPVDESGAAAGMLAPGDLVDLLLITREDGDSTVGATVRPLLQAVRVVATGQQMQRRRAVVATAAGGEPLAAVDNSFATVTLHVSPADAERVVLAQRIGELAVVLRPSSETEPAALGAIDGAALFGAARSRRRTHATAGVEFIVGGLGSAAHRTLAGSRLPRREQP